MRDLRHPMHDVSTSPRFQVYQAVCQMKRLGALCEDEECEVNADCASECCSDNLCNVNSDGSADCMMFKIPVWSVLLIASIVILVIAVAILVLCYAKR